MAASVAARGTASMPRIERSGRVVVHTTLHSAGAGICTSRRRVAGGFGSGQSRSASGWLASLGITCCFASGRRSFTR